MIKKVKKKKMETSKILLYVNYAIVLSVMYFTFKTCIMTGDLTALNTLIQCVFVELGVSTGFYYWKEKNENMLKLSNNTKVNILDSSNNDDFDYSKGEV